MISNKRKNTPPTAQRPPRYPGAFNADCRCSTMADEKYPSKPAPLLSEAWDLTDFVVLPTHWLNFAPWQQKMCGNVRPDYRHIQTRQGIAVPLVGCFYRLAQIHIYPASSSSASSRAQLCREMGIRIYERTSAPSYKDFASRRRSSYLPFRKRRQMAANAQYPPMVGFVTVLLRVTPNRPNCRRRASRLADSACCAPSKCCLSRTASEAIEPDLIRIAPAPAGNAILQFVALNAETAKLVRTHYRNGTAPDTAHLEVMFDQCFGGIDYLRRKGTGVGSCSSVKVAHLLERLRQTVDRIWSCSPTCKPASAAASAWPSRWWTPSSRGGRTIQHPPPAPQQHPYARRSITENKAALANTTSPATARIFQNVLLGGRRRRHHRPDGAAQSASAHSASARSSLPCRPGSSTASALWSSICCTAVAAKQSAMTARQLLPDRSRSQQEERQSGGQQSFAKLLIDVCPAPEASCVFGNVSHRHRFWRAPYRSSMPICV